MSEAEIPGRTCEGKITTETEQNIPKAHILWDVLFQVIKRSPGSSLVLSKVLLDKTI